MHPVQKVSLEPWTCVFCITSAVSILGAYKPCPLETCCFRLALFCSLLFWTCRMSTFHQNATLNSLGSAATHLPRVKSIGWTVPAFIREKNMFSPLPPKEGLLPKLRSSKNGIRTSPNLHTVFVLSAATSLLSFSVVGKPDRYHTSDLTGHQQSTLPLQQPLLFKMCKGFI